VPFWISLGILLDPGWPSWLRYTLDILCCLESPLPSTADLSRNRVRLVNFVQKVFNRTDRPVLVRKLFTNAFGTPSLCWWTSLIDALSSYVKWRYTVFLIAFPVSWVAFIYFIPLQNCWKYLQKICTCYSELIIFQRALFTLYVHSSWKT